MSSAVARSGDSGGRWWSLKSQSSSSSLSSKHSAGTLSNLATAMGFKSKKVPTMAIEQPPLSVITSQSRPLSSPRAPSRPASKSVSSTRSRVDSVGPKTPVDGPPLHRQSLYTLSDEDPFAAPAIALQHSPDPNRLSAYSVSLSPDYITKKNDPFVNRISYASSSSHSIGEISPLSSPTPPDVPPLLINKRRKPPDYNTGLGPAFQNDSGLVKTNSATTLTDVNRFSQPDPPPKPRPRLRASGMTDGGAGVHPRFFRSESSTNSTLPSPIGQNRHISARANGPTTAPPSQELPPPPMVDLDDPHLDINSPISGISFASPMLTARDFTMLNQHYTARTKSPDLSPFPLIDTDPPAVLIPPPRTVKKAVSQQSLNKHSNLPSTTSAPTSPSDAPLEKTLRKQRSFHHPRIPLPSIPLPFHAPFPSQSTVAPVESAIPDSRSSITNPSGSTRKRLFSSSSSRRPSTSNGDDDTRSIFSLRSESTKVNTSTSNIITSNIISTNPHPQPSFWEESGQVTPSSPDWQPQQIMSPAEMARLEAKMEEEESVHYQRKRGMSILSTSTTTSSGDHFNSSSSAMLPSRTASILTKISVDTSKRPSTSQGTPTASPTTSVSLTPPPRSWQRPSTSSGHSSKVLPLSPPPRRSRGHKTVEQPVSLDKAMRRRSIMRKPSFLDIDDDRDTETEIRVKNGPHRLENSFLDLARESFDTVRSGDE